MRRLALAAAASLLAATPALADGSFRDAKDNFELSYPSNWEVKRPTDPKIVFMAGTVVDGSQAACDARVEPARSSKDEMDEREFKTAFPLPQLEARYPKGTHFDAETYTTQGGLPVLHVEATSTNRNGVRVHIAQRWVYWKRNFITLNCAAPASSFESFRPDVTRFLNSFRRL